MPQTSEHMHVYEWDKREIAAFNALFSHDPHAKRLLNHWPEKTSCLFILRWTTNGMVRHAVHFCEGEANWRAGVYNEVGANATVEKRFQGQGQSYAIVDGRQRPGCQCENCQRYTQDLVPIAAPKREKISSAKARKLARAEALSRFG